MSPDTTTTPLTFRKYSYLLIFFIFLHPQRQQAQPLAAYYPAYDARVLSPGKTTYYIDPQQGNDRNSGTDKSKAWQSFKRVNQLILSPGDQVEILRPGSFQESLIVVAHGQSGAPVTITFAPGRYDIFSTHAKKIPLHISNTNDQPYEPKAIALMFDSCQFLNVLGTETKFVMRGKMIESYINKCTDVKMEGLKFDYERPTVSELTVLRTGANFSDLRLHPDSKFSVKDGVLYWEGEGWRDACSSYWQKLHLQSDYVSRMSIPVADIRFVKTGEHELRAYYTLPIKGGTFEKGNVYQTRDIARDCAGLFIQRSKNIGLKNVRIYYMHGMGIVSQFSENIAIDQLVVRPASTSGRTCAAWADVLHFSGCKGLISISNSYLSAANDDAINIHGTHLLIKKSLKKQNQMVVKFMHGQTYGFSPFVAGDSLDFIRPKTLLPIGDNVVLACEKRNDKEFLLTLKNALPKKLRTNDAVENTTATPEVWIYNNTISRIPTRGILVTTRRKIRIDHNQFLRTAMSAVLVSDDASSWFESGMVKNLSLTQNNFERCAGPVIAVLPENRRNKKQAVHSNMTISGNTFSLVGFSLLSAKNIANLKFENNTIHSPFPILKIEELIKLKKCKPVSLLNNTIILEQSHQ